MGSYNLRFKDSPNSTEYWNTTIHAENDKEAIAKVEEIRKDCRHYKCKLEVCCYNFKTIHKWEE